MCLTEGMGTRLGAEVEYLGDSRAQLNLEAVRCLRPELGLRSSGRACFASQVRLTLGYLVWAVLVPLQEAQFSAGGR